MTITRLSGVLNLDWIPHALVGAGILLSGIMLAEVGTLALSPGGFAAESVATFLATIPFLAILVGGGYWLAHSDLRADRYPRIAAWTLGGFVFLAGFFSIIAAFTTESLLVQIGMMRWAGATGAGAGALVGTFEARAIDRALVSQRTTIRNEELERQNDRLEEFARILSHDLRNPLNVATGYVEILQEEYDGGEFDRIVAAHDRMEQIIEQTLILARSGQIIDEPEPVPLPDIVDRSWANVETNAATLENTSTGTIVADADRVQHVFENLFRNALEHGGEDVTIRVGMCPNGFYVEDDGPGIPADEREKVLSSGYSSSEDGNGIGLAIVRQIVQAHGWDVSVTEGADGGARFEITGVDTDNSVDA